MFKILIICFIYFFAFFLAYISFVDIMPTHFNHVYEKFDTESFISVFFKILFNNTLVWFLLLSGVLTFGILSILVLLYNVYNISLLVFVSLQIHSWAIIVKIVLIHGIVEFFSFSMIVFFAMKYFDNYFTLKNYFNEKKKIILFSYFLLILAAFIETIIYNSI